MATAATSRRVTDSPATTPTAKRRVSLGDTKKGGSGLPPRVILQGQAGIGKCLGKGTPIIMYDGTVKPVEEVKEGDLLLGPDSNPRTVRGLDSGYCPMFRVIPTKGDSYVVTGNHILSLKTCDTGKPRDPHNISVKEWFLKSATWRKYAKGWRTAVEWTTQNQPIPPYLFGCWLGDGTSIKPDITTPEPEVVAAMTNYASDHGMRVVKRDSSGTADTLAISTRRSGGTIPNQFMDALRYLDVVNNKHVPYVYLIASTEQRLELLSGLLDTDGHLICGCYEIVQKSKQLADDILFLARSLGFAAYSTVKRSVCSNSPIKAVGDYHRIHISGDLSRIPIRVSRKKPSARKQIKDVLVTGITIEPCGNDEYFGFELDGDGLFLLGDFTVTHNTIFAESSDNPYFILSPGETGLLTLIDAGLASDQTPHIEVPDWDSLIGIVEELTTVNHTRKSLVIDTVDGMEKLARQYTCDKDFGGDWSEKGFEGFQRGYRATANGPWRSLLMALDKLRVEKQMWIILLAHTGVSNFRNPRGPDFNSYKPAMSKDVWELTLAWADICMFADRPIFTEKMRGEQKAKAAGAGDRVLFTEWDAMADAKNRHNLPSEISMGSSGKEAWANFVSAIEEGKQKGKEVS